MKPGADSFNEYYEKRYGARWKTLRESLLESAQTVPYRKGLTVPYYLDRASILAASLLRLPDSASDLPGQQGAMLDLESSDTEFPPLVLDACAAPGGKTLVVASRMAGNTRLLANEFSSERRRRLVSVLDTHLGTATRNRVTISGFDAAAAAGRQSERGRFAAVLLDAPCSSERHVMQNPAALQQWTPARPRFLARRQWALLSSAFLLLAPGGSLVYSTCSINMEENEGVVQRLLEKYRNACILDKPEFTVSSGARTESNTMPDLGNFYPKGEETRYGFIILPDVSEGSGPMYVARFRKNTDCRTAGK